MNLSLRFTNNYHIVFAFIICLINCDKMYAMEVARNRGLVANSSIRHTWINLPPIAFMKQASFHTPETSSSSKIWIVTRKTTGYVSGNDIYAAYEKNHKKESISSITLCGQLIPRTDDDCVKVEEVSSYSHRYLVHLNQ
jgi:hypothetical protein